MARKNYESEQPAEQAQEQPADAQVVKRAEDQQPEEQKDEEQKPKEQKAEEQPEVKVNIVIFAYPGTEEKMAALWKKALPAGLNLLVLPAGQAISGETPVESVAEEINSLAEAAIADNRIDDNFVLVPANTFPTHRIDPVELELPVVYVDKVGKETFAHRLPQLCNKAELTELLAEREFWNPEDFAKKALERRGTLPVKVGMSFGNFVTNVLRANPCEHQVIEAFLRKKYISCNSEGWKGIEKIVDQFLAE